MTLNRTYYSKKFGAVVTIRFEQASNKMIWVRTVHGTEHLMFRSHLSA
jgi:hypothetical protein